MDGETRYPVSKKRKIKHFKTGGNIMSNKIWRFREDMLGHYINSTSSRTFQDAENRLNQLEDKFERKFRHIAQYGKVVDLGINATGGFNVYYESGEVRTVDREMLLSMINF